MAKRPLGIDVLTAARQRISWTFDNFRRVYVSFSGGKDSSVMLHLVADEAKKRGVKFGVLIVDLESQYKHTIAHIEQMVTEYTDQIDLYWVALPIALRNAVSMFEPKWLCWDPDRMIDWVRQPDDRSITGESAFPFFVRGMEFEDFVPAFGEWYAQGEPCACLVGIRSDESLNRYRTIASKSKARFDNLSWTSWLGIHTVNVYPIYDWKTADIWTYNGKFYKPYNKIYDLMNKAGVPLHNQRICQPYGDDQKRGLWLFHLLEPETWAKVLARVNGANSGSLYVQEHGNINGTIKVSLPKGHTWKSFSLLILESLPPKSKEHFENKIAVFLKWWTDRGYPNGIPDEVHPDEENSRKKPSWRRIAKSLLRNDYWCKGLSFGMNKATSYDRYLKVMKNRRREWGIFWS